MHQLWDCFEAALTAQRLTIDEAGRQLEKVNDVGKEGGNWERQGVDQVRAHKQNSLRKTMRVIL